MLLPLLRAERTVKDRVRNGNDGAKKCGSECEETALQDMRQERGTWKRSRPKRKRRQSNSHDDPSHGRISFLIPPVNQIDSQSSPGVRLRTGQMIFAKLTVICRARGLHAYDAPDSNGWWTIRCTRSQLLVPPGSVYRWGSHLPHLNFRYRSVADNGYKMNQKQRST